MKPERELDLKEILLYLWQHIVIIAICMLMGSIGCISVMLIGSRNDLPYEASAMIYFDVLDTLGEKSTEGIDQFDYYKNITDLSNAVIKSSQLLDVVVDNLDLETNAGELANRISVTTVGSSSFMRLTVKDKDSETAQCICNEILTVMPDVSASMTNLGALRAVSQAVVTATAKPGVIKGAIVGGLLGIIASVLTLIAIELFDHSIRDAQDIEYYLGMKALGVIPVASQRHNVNLAAEAYRSLCLNLEAENADSTPSVVFVTGICELGPSAESAEKLARTFARMGKKMALVDADLRNGSISKQLGLWNKEGLSEYLQNTVPLETILHYEENIGGTVVSCGKAEHNSTEQFTPESIRKFFGELRERFDVVVVYTGAVALTSDAVALSRMADKVLLVARVGKTPVECALLAKEKMEFVKAPVSGVVLTDYNYKQARRRDGYFYAFSAKQG